MGVHKDEIPDRGLAHADTVPPQPSTTSSGQPSGPPSSGPPSSGDEPPPEQAEVGVELGQQIGSYHLVSRLGDGGMGVVFKGVHEQLSRFAAIKVLHSSLTEDPEMIARFFTEAESVNIVRHPGIVNIFEFGQLKDQTVYIVMEFLEGESLYQRQVRVGRLGPDGARLFRQMASALAAAHERGVVHRDLKPENVMIVADTDVQGGERTKILDFGIAKMAEQGRKTVLAQDPGDEGSASTKPAGGPDREAPRAPRSTGREPSRSIAPGPPPGSRGLRLTRAGMVFGTPTYMSPEQCVDSGQVTDRSDVYALGVMLFEALSGNPPFGGENVSQIMTAHMFDDPPDLRALAPDTPPALAALCARMLAKDPVLRPSMGEVVVALDAVLAPPVQPPRGWRRLSLRARAALIALPVCALLGLGGGAGYLVHRRAQAQERDLGYLRSRAVGLLQERLRDADPALRRQAIGLLVESSDERFRTLIEPLLADPDVGVQVRAAEALGQLRARASAPTLLSRARAAPLKSGSPALFLAIARALRELGDPHGEQLLREAAKDEGARRPALLALAALGDGPSRTALAQDKLSDDELLGLLGQLARTGDQAARDELGRNLRAPPDPLSLRIAATLAATGDQRARAVLAEAARRTGPLQLYAGWLLAQTDAGCSDEVRGLFRGALTDRARPVAERALSVQGAAACGPTQEVHRLSPLLLHPEAGPAGARLLPEAGGGILRLLASDPELVAQESLAWATGMLEDGDWTRRRDAVSALGMTASRLSLPLLQKALQDPDLEVRRRVVWALGRMRSPAAVPMLTAAMSDKAPEVRDQAMRALGLLGPVQGDPMGPALDERLARVTTAPGLPPDEVLRLLRGAAADPDPEVRRQAAEAAAAVVARVPGAGAVLRDLVRDPDRLVRTQAAVGLRAPDTGAVQQDQAQGPRSVQTQAAPPAAGAGGAADLGHGAADLGPGPADLGSAQAQEEADLRAASSKEEPAQTGPGEQPDREARSAAVTDREARSAAVTDREARSAAVTDREARSAAVIDPHDKGIRKTKKRITNRAILLPKRALHGKAGIDDKGMEIDETPQ